MYIENHNLQRNSIIIHYFDSKNCVNRERFANVSGKVHLYQPSS